jgi:hypothetical protein
VRGSRQRRGKSGECHQFCTFGFGHHAGVGGLCFLVGLLCRGQGAQFLVPVRLQRVSYQAVIGIDLEETALRQIRFVARPLYVLVPHPVRLLVAAREFLLHRQRDFNCKRRHRLDHYFSDGAVERTAVHGLT